jgi:hypothetical protein
VEQAKVIARRVLALLASISLLGVIAKAQSAPDTARRSLAYRYRVLGVYDAQTGDPIEGVEVADIMGGNKSMTTSTGTVSLLFLPDGGGIVRLRKVGYEVQTLMASISPTDTAPITVILSRAVALPAVVVKDSATKFNSPGMRAFEERRKTGIGSFIGTDEMRKNDDKVLSDLIGTRMPGLRTSPGRSGAQYLISTRKMCAGSSFVDTCRQPNCYVSVYIDGAKVFDAGMGLALAPDFGRLSVQDFAGAEFYASGASAPPQYNVTDQGCGILILWSRVK